MLLGRPDVISRIGLPGHVTPNLSLLHHMGYTVHLVDSGASGPQNVSLFFMLGCGVVSINNASRHFILNLCFCIWLNLRIT
jgi:hypothetical protein